LALSVRWVNIDAPCAKEFGLFQSGKNVTFITRVEITSKLPEAEILAIIALVRTHTDEVIVSVADDEFGPEVKTGRLYGYVWIIRKAPSGWKVMQKIQWVT